jgi:hypothetical protein
MWASRVMDLAAIRRARSLEDVDHGADVVSAPAR